jgi:hypothetical protein
VSGEFDDCDLDPVYVSGEFDNCESCLSTSDALCNTASMHLPAPTLGSVSNNRSAATAPAAEKRPRLEDLNGVDLCRLLATCGLSEQQYIVKEQTLNGGFLVCWKQCHTDCLPSAVLLGAVLALAVDTVDDLVHAGMKYLPAKLLFRTLENGKRTVCPRVLPWQRLRP